MNGSVLVAALLGSSLAVSGGAGGPTAEATLVITSVESGQVFTRADDTNLDLEGVQIAVEVMAVGLAAGEQVAIGVSSVPISTAAVPSDGVIRFTDVTIGSGTHTLTARAREGALISPPVTVTIDDGCFGVTFVSPEATGERVTLGPSDDTDGSACDGSFETEFVISTTAPDSSMARIFVNDTPRRTATVSGGVARFSGVGLDLGVDNRVSVTVDTAASAGCPAVAFAGTIALDCDGVACSITAPTSDTAFLNQDHDVSAEDGFQTDFEVTTDADGAGQVVRLIIDGNETDARSERPDGTTATFGNVSLSEGVHRVRAECRDAAGNVTRSSSVEWTIDITPCAVTLGAPADGELFIDGDDVDTSTEAIDILASGTAGADCTGLRVATCSGIGAVAFGDVDSSWSSQVTLGSMAMQSVCAETRDEAGNIARAMAGVRLNTAAPQVEIASPADGTNYNIAGDSTHTADLVSGNSTCEAAFEVYCTAVDTDVTIRRATGTMATLGTASCVADASVPPPYSGKATFPMLPLPSVQDGSQFGVVATQTFDRLTGTSAPISLRSDCVAPTFAVTRPTCGATLRPGTQDESDDPGFQYRTVVQNPGLVPVTLTIQTDGGTVVSMATNSSGTTPLSFVDADYGAGGVLDLIATGVDSAGNVGTSPACQVTVEDVPSVNITSPVMGAVLRTTDCGAGEVRVQGTSDAPDGSAVAVTINGTVTNATTTASGGGSAFNVCAAAADSRSATIRVAITDTRGTGTGTVVVVIDTMPPTDAIDDLEVVTVVDRRGGLVKLGWTGVEDAGGVALDEYVLRCADAEITDETTWAAAMDMPLMTVPSTGTPALTEDVGGYRVGNNLHCALRGVDPTGALTPLGPSVEITLEFLTHVVTPDAATDPALLGLGVEMAAVGDVNGDGYDDVLVGGTNGAGLFFGSAAGDFADHPSVLFQGDIGGMEYQVAGLGDFNGDTRPDIALAPRNSTTRASGRVFVFFGRSSTEPWPFVCGLGDASACSEDLSLVGTEIDASLGSAFGSDIGAAGDFDGDGLMDLAVGNWVGADRAGVVYVILGRVSFSAASFELPSDTLPAPDAIAIAAPTGTQYFGFAVDSAGGTVTGDSRHDLVVGSAAATVFVAAGQPYSGGPGVVPNVAATVSVVEVGSSGLGKLVAPAGDIDGNGRLDLLASSSISSTRGEVRRYLGGSGGFGAPVTILGNGNSADNFGSSLGLARHPSALIGVIGDVDRDGRADTFAGANNDVSAAAGAAYLFYNDPPIVAESRATADVVFHGSSGDGPRRAGFIGDVNGDGFGDLGVGDPASASSAGRFTILY